jgi:hypothetical protein
MNAPFLWGMWLAKFSVQEISAANKDTMARLQVLQKDVVGRAEEQAKAAEKKADTTYRHLSYMIWIAFILGLVLIGISIGLFVFSQRTLDVLGMSALGVADWIAIFVYKPMDRLQKANADYAEQFTVLKGWAVSINLELLAMDTEDSESVKTAARNIKTVSLETAEAFQKFIE